MIPLIGQKPHLPTLVLNGGHVDGKIFLQFAPVGMLTIEQTEEMILGLQAAVNQAKMDREAMRAAVQGNGAGKVDFRSCETGT